MLLVIHNLPATTRYADVKALLQLKCGIQQMILDDLVIEGICKKVTVGVAEDADAAILTRKINGLFWNGQHLYVEDVRQQKALLDQPYRSMNPQSKPQAELPYNSMDLGQNSSFNMMSAQQMMTPMYYMPMPAYPNNETYAANVMNTAPNYRPEKVQSAYPGISGFSQNASAAPQYRASQFDDQDYGQPAKRSRWEDNNQNSANEESSYGPKQARNRDWPTNRVASPPRDQSRDGCKPVWRTANDGPIQPDFRANVRPNQPDYRSNAGPTEPDFRPNVRPTEPDFRSTIRPKERSDFVRPALLDKPRREFGSNIQRRENEHQERSDKREIFSRKPNEDKFSRKPNNEFSRKPNDVFTRRPNDEFARRPNDEFTRRPNDEFARRPNDEFSRRPPRPNERAEFSRRPIVPHRSNERQGSSQFSGKPSGREEPSRRPNEEFSRRPNEVFSRRPNDREDRPKRPNEQSMFSSKPNVPNRSNERHGTNQVSERPEFFERQGKSSRYNPPNIHSNYFGFDRNERPDVSRRTSVHDQRSITDSRKRKFEEFKPKSSQQTSAPPKPLKEPFVSGTIAVPPLTESGKEKLNKKMRLAGTNKILHDIYNGLNYQDQEPDPLMRRTFRQVVTERVNVLLGDKKMVTSMETLEIYRTKYPKSEDQEIREVVVQRIAQIAEQENGGNQAVKPVVKPVKPVYQPPPSAAPKQMAAPTRPPPPKLSTKGERRAMKKLKDAKHLLSQGKLPKFPLGDKSQVAKQRKEDKLGTIPETDPTMEAALTDEVDALLQICADELVNPPEETTREIYKSVCPEEFIGGIKTIITQSLARRITDSGLKVVRVYGRPKLPKREVLEKFLIKFGVQSLRKSDKVKMFTAAVDTYKNFDKLCNTTFNAPDGISVHFKPFHVAPKERANQTRLKKIRKQNINKMIDKSELNLLDKDWPQKEEEIKAIEAEKQAKLAAEWAAFEERKALEESQAVKTEKVAGEPNTENGDDNTENEEREFINITINKEDFEEDETNTTADESNDHFHDDFHVIDEVNETDSEIECLGDTSKTVFYLDEDIDGVANDESVNNGNDSTAENNDVENVVGDNDDGNDANIEDQNDTNIEKQNVKIVEDSENNDGENNADNDDSENKYDLIDGDDDVEMGDADIDNLDVDIDELDDGDLEDY